MANMVAENQEGIDGNEHKFFGYIGRRADTDGIKNLEDGVERTLVHVYRQGGTFKASIDLYSAPTRYTSADASTIVKSVTGLAEVDAWSKFHQNCSRRNGGTSILDAGTVQVSEACE